MAEQAQPLLEDYHLRVESSQSSCEGYPEKSQRELFWQRLATTCSNIYKRAVPISGISGTILRRLWRGSRREQSFSRRTSDDRSAEQLLNDSEGQVTTSVSRRYAATAESYLLLILPRFLRSQGFEPYTKLHSTSYLDALRGIAALIVLNHHHWPLGTPLTFFNLPIIRVIIAGRGSVAVFFVISGYVLSSRTLKAIHQHTKVKVLDGLTSSTFRRYLRLFLPCAVASFASMVLVHNKWASPELEQLSFREGLLEQLWDWFTDFISFANPFVDLQGGYWHGYYVSSRYFHPLQVLWTIPVEFRGSMAVFGFVLAICKLKTRTRLILTAALIGLCYCWRAIWAALFVYGVLLADISLVLQPQRHGLETAMDITNLEKPKGRFNDRSTWLKFASVFAMLLSLFLLGQPISEEGISFPYTYLAIITPSYLGDNWAQAQFYPSFGAALLVLALDISPMLRKPLECRFSQYLGALSFGIYTMHTLVLMSVWDRCLVPLQTKSFGNGYLASGVLLLVLYFIVLWIADYFERIDRKIVTLGRWIEGRIFVA